MIGVDLFSGAGGMSLGARLAGVRVIYAVEKDVHAAQTYRRNFPEVDVFNGDIRELESLPIVGDNTPRVLFGGAPCQGFSTSNQRTRTRLNKSNWMFAEFVRLTEAWMPEWFVFENVKGLAETESGAFLELILGSFKRLGYTLTTALLNAADFGVPQRRERLFVVGSREGKKVQLPRKHNRKCLPVKHALADLPLLENGARIDRLPYRSQPRSAYARQLRGNLQTVSGNLVTRNAQFVLDRYRHVNPGGNWESIPKELMQNYRPEYECHTGIYHRLDAEKPSVVIGNYRKNMLIHPLEDRGLSVREAARIQSFPDDFEFCGSIGFQQQQVGNAVPPLLAKAVFQQVILTQLCNGN